MVEWREGDWECPDCGALVFASRETCFKCDRASQRKEGDWDCPDCGFLVFASKESCPKCDRAASKGKGKGGSSKGGRAGAEGASLVSSPSAHGDAIKVLAKLSTDFKKAWVSYCKQYGEGFSDPSKYGKEFIAEFADYVATCMRAEDEGEGAASAGVPPTSKRPAVDNFAEERNAKAARVGAVAAHAAGNASAGEKKKVTMKKSVAEEIRRLNAQLTTPIRPGAVAGALASLSESAALTVLAAVEDIDPNLSDPNTFIREEACRMLEEQAELS
eukprot:TRINITY_DN17215_c0_g3_i2.p1 TRINITY_DN17215_c0_g3~~TRINITY_DN17215_c0_g3_i2.p1  ORF type:complete len:291 (-),score=57.66 TRINITY_DN17215_c0_g3_i2:172-990(-)